MVHHSTATAAPCLASSAQDGLKCTIPPLPLQVTTQQASCPGLLVCPLPPRVGGAIDTAEPSSQAENSLGGGTHEHPTHQYTPLSMPLETTNVCKVIAPNINFSYPCEDSEVESTHTPVGTCQKMAKLNVVSCICTILSHYENTEEGPRGRNVLFITLYAT